MICVWMNIAEVCVYDARDGTIHYVTEVGQAGNFWDTPRMLLYPTKTKDLLNVG